MLEDASVVRLKSEQANKSEARSEVAVVKNRLTPKWHPGKWKHGLKPAVP